MNNGWEFKWWKCSKIHFFNGGRAKTQLAAPYKNKGLFWGSTGTGINCFQHLHVRLLIAWMDKNAVFIFYFFLFFCVKHFNCSVRFWSSIPIIGHAHLSFSDCVKYHSHRIISHHKLSGAAVCVWHQTKSGTQQHKAIYCMCLFGCTCV